MEGLIAAAVTPRNPDEEIDFGATFDLLDFLGRAGIHGIALFTGAGEYASLPVTERCRLLYLAAKRCRPPLFAGIGAATLEGSLTLARQASGADVAGLLLPPPHFFRYDQDDIREFYLQFAAHANFTTRVYIIDTPEWTTPIAPQTMNELLAAGYFAGSAGNLSELACAVPEVAALWRDDPAALQERTREFDEWSRQFPATVALKAALNLRGLKTGRFHVPLPAEKQRKLDEFREWFQAWLADCKKIAARA